MTLSPLAQFFIAWQRVVYERPPAGTLQRGLIALPRWPTVIVVVIAIAALIALTLRTRYGARRPPNATRHRPR